jgi:hypothetical protein
MKRSSDSITNNGGQERLAKATLVKVGMQVTKMTQKLCYDVHRRCEGMEALAWTGAVTEGISDRRVLSVEERSTCKEVGIGLANLFRLKNMSEDWKEVGWMHLKNIFSEGFARKMLESEANALLTTLTEVSSTGYKKRSIDIAQNCEWLEAFPIHEMVIVELAAAICGRRVMIRETMVSMTIGQSDSTPEFSNKKLSDKIMKQLGNGKKEMECEPIAMIIPLSAHIWMKTQEQLGLHKGRPRKGKDHLIEVGDIFIVSWRQWHATVREKRQSDDASEKRYIVVSVGEDKEFLIY